MALSLRAYGAMLWQRVCKVHTGFLTILRDAALVVVACTVAALGFNMVRGAGIPLVQREEYQILVPCPETTGEALALSSDAAVLQDSQALVIDARGTEAFAKWHLARAISVPFDYLEATPPEVIRRIASSGAREVIVYGDGQNPDSGEQLAREISGKGIRNVRFVSGGAPALLANKPTGDRP
jgi:hypothetical protein